MAVIFSNNLPQNYITFKAEKKNTANISNEKPQIATSNNNNLLMFSLTTAGVLGSIVISKKMISKPAVKNLYKTFNAPSPINANIIKSEKSIFKQFISKIKNIFNKPKQKIKQFVAEPPNVTKKTKGKNNFWNKLNPKNWFNKTNKRTLTSLESKQAKTEPRLLNNIKKRFKIFKHNIKRAKTKTFDLQKQNIGSRIKAFFSTGKKSFVNTTQKLFSPIKAYTDNFINKPKAIEAIVPQSIPEAKQTLWSKGKLCVEEQKTRIQKHCKTKTGSNNKKFTNKKSDDKKIQNKNIYPELEEKTKTRIQIFRSKRVNIKKATKRIDNLYNTIIKSPERLTGKSYENDMISLCNSVGHSFDTLNRNPNYVDSLIKEYGNMKHLTSTLSPEEIRMVSKLEQVFKKFKEIRFPNQQIVRG